MLAVVAITSLFDVNVLANFPYGQNTVNGILVGMVFILVDTLICWIFLGIVARSPHFVGCFTVFKNLISLPKFWILVSLLVLYILGAALVLSHFFSRASQNQDATMKVAIGMDAVIEVLNCFTKVALVAVLNYVQIRNVARSRFKYRLLKGTLVVIWLSQISTLIGAMVQVYHVVVRLSPLNSQMQQESSFAELVINLFLLPIVTRTAELIWTKILQDNKCIIGKYEGSSFTRQNAIETII